MSTLRTGCLWHSTKNGEYLVDVCGTDRYANYTPCKSLGKSILFSLCIYKFKATKDLIYYLIFIIL